MGFEVWPSIELWSLGMGLAIQDAQAAPQGDGGYHKKLLVLVVVVAGG